MGKVRLRIPPWAASVWNAPASGWLTLEKEIGEGATIGDLLAALVYSYTDFRKVVFDPDTRKVSGQVMVILNDSLLQCPDVAKVELSNGDSVLLLPVYAGG